MKTSIEKIKMVFEFEVFVSLCGRLQIPEILKVYDTLASAAEVFVLAVF